MKNSTTARAYGRVNLIGEHTDYNGGWVLPTTIPQYTEITVERTNGQIIRAESGADRKFTWKLGEERPMKSWGDYLQGATKILLENGHKLSGLEVKIQSTIPEGSGLSSSAALEMSFLMALKELFNLDITETDLARIGQEIENDFVGARVGIMDQMATSIARSGEALYLDTLTLDYERVPLPLEELDILVINSGISHKLSATDGGYNERRAQCEEAARLLGVKYLREMTLKELELKDLPPILKQRAKHVVTENDRVHEAVRAIKSRNLDRLGKLFYESHKSMRDDFEVSIPEVDLLVDLCMLQKDVMGARLTGGGFGGSIVAITKKDKKNLVAETILPLYQKQTGVKGVLLA
ncbi:MAG: galactokinase [Bacteriovoracia bacterium]